VDAGALDGPDEARTGRRAQRLPASGSPADRGSREALGLSGMPETRGPMRCRGVLSA